MVKYDLSLCLTQYYVKGVVSKSVLMFIFKLSLIEIKSGRMIFFMIFFHET